MVNAENHCGTLRPLLVAIALAVVTVAVYLPSLQNSYVNWDDDDYVAANPAIAGGLTWQSFKWSLEAVHAVNWHPLTWISHAIDVSIYGRQRVWGHHLSSILLHAAAAMALLLALERLTGRLWAAAATAVLFALHPLHVESVSWISERKDVLCALFIFVTLRAYAWYVERPSLGRYSAVLVATACAMLSKPMAVTLPVVLLALDYWPLARLPGMKGPGRFGASGSWRAVWEKVPLAAMSCGLAAVTWLAQVGARESSGSSTSGMPARAALAAYSYVTYLAKAFWPAPSWLVPFIPLPQYGGPAPGAATIALSAAALAAITAAAIMLRKRRPYLLTGWFIYAIMLVPVCGLAAQVGRQTMADRYTYVPLVGVFLAVACAVDDAAAHRARLRAAAIVLATVALAALGWITWGQQAVWRNSLSLWGRVAQAFPNCPVAWNALGHVYTGVDPDPQLRANVDLNKAEECYRKAIAIDPDFAEPRAGLGAIMAEKRRFAEAEEQFRKAVELSPGYAEGHYNYGVLLLKRGRPREALEEFNRALAIDHDYDVARQGVAEARRKLAGNLRP